MRAAVRLVNEVPQGRALGQVPGDVAEDGEAEPVRHEFLDELAGDTGSEPEEIVPEPFHRDHNQAGSALQRLANHFDCVPVRSKFLPVGRAFEDCHWKVT
jgi:hypothetical protein